MEAAMQAWVYLVLAGILEVVWAFAMKQSEGFTKLGPTIITLVAMVASFALLALAMRSLPLGTAYPIWTGIGAVGAFAVGVLMLGEPLHALRVSAAAMILGGLVLMKMA
jgi:quaternary ammonium compound-resistance protein SugE